MLKLKQAKVALDLLSYNGDLVLSSYYSCTYYFVSFFSFKANIWLYCFLMMQQGGLIKETWMEEDPREAILKYADAAANDPKYIAPAYAQTQPKPVFAESDSEAEENEKWWLQTSVWVYPLELSSSLK